ncbi:guanine nucleotide binding protein, alpha subunit [Sporodiniella umbellata]|nr:guanine nucleotide binding protein, alpha subunit [Sporodiniella umbellata]
MGNCRSVSLRSSKNSQEAQKSKRIDKQIKADEKRLRSEVKVLLLGAGESGKSTLLKQLRLIHTSGFDDNERESYRIIVFSNIIMEIQTIFEAMQLLNIHFENEENNASAYVPLIEHAKNLKEKEPYPPSLLNPLLSLWADKGVQNSRKEANTMFALHDNASYFFNNLERFWASDYIPNDQDIVRCRAKSTGIIETTFHLEHLTYRMFDVGGQRSERKKWIHCFENVTAILFVVAISGYDQCLVEDKDGNQMHESLMLFDNICNSRWFTDTSIILFLNKIDIFQKKILVSPVSRWFPDFDGDNSNSESAIAYFKTRFRRLNQNPNKPLYAHCTDATDANLLEHVMKDVSDMILNENLNTNML